jgi:hypothetical protein
MFSAGKNRRENVMFQTIAEAVRPAVDRRQCGACGEILFQFGAVLEKAFPQVRVQRDLERDVLISLVAGLQVHEQHRLLKKNALRVLAGKPVLESVR